MKITHRKFESFVHSFILKVQALLFLSLVCLCAANQGSQHNTQPNQYYSTVLQGQDFPAQFPLQYSHNVNSQQQFVGYRQSLPIQTGNYQYRQALVTKRQEGHSGASSAQTNEDSITNDIKLLGIGGVTKIMLAVFPFLITLIFIPLLLVTIGVLLIPVIRFQSYGEDTERKFPTQNYESMLDKIMENISPGNKKSVQL